MLVVGDKECDNQTVSVRCRKEGDMGAMSVADFAAMACEKDAPARWTERCPRFETESLTS